MQQLLRITDRGLSLVTWPSSPTRKEAHTQRPQPGAWHPFGPHTVLLYWSSEPAHFPQGQTRTQRPDLQARGHASCPVPTLQACSPSPGPAPSEPHGHTTGQGRRAYSDIMGVQPAHLAVWWLKQKSKDPVAPRSRCTWEPGLVLATAQATEGHVAQDPCSPHHGGRTGPAVGTPAQEPTLRVSVSSEQDGHGSRSAGRTALSAGLGSCAWNQSRRDLCCYSQSFRRANPAERPCSR